VTTNMLKMANRKIYKFSYPKKSPDNNDITVEDTTTSKVVFTNTRIIFITQIDTSWTSSTQKSKTVLKWIYDGSFSFSGNTLATIKSTNIDQITFAGYGLGYDTRSNLTQYSKEGVCSFRFNTPHKNLNTALLDTVKGSLLYNYSTTGENTLVPYLGGRLFASSSVPVSTDRSVIPTSLTSSELKYDWWMDPFSEITKVHRTNRGADTLTGVDKFSDTFIFGNTPEFGSSSDTIVNFSVKDKDALQFSKSAFGVSTWKFAIAKKSGNLNKFLATDTNIVYNQQKGELIFNANGPEAGFGVDGGVFAHLVNAPKLIGALVSFV